MQRPNRGSLVPALAALILLAAACGGAGNGPGEDAGATAPVSGKMSDANFTVGSKEFTEQLILGQMAILALRNAGAQVNDKTGIQGTANVRRALTSSEIDLYWEYTGTGWVNHLGHTPADAPKGAEALHEQVAREDVEKNAIVWLRPAPMNNTYAIAAAASTVDELGIRTLSDYARLVTSDPDKARLCAAAEFLTRDDGLPGLEQAYGFELQADNIIEVDLGVIYTEVAKEGRQCNFGEVFATDGRIVANDLVIVEDDRNFFVKYNVALTVRKQTFDEHPELADIFEPITARLTTEEMTELNAKVDVNGELPEDVARQWLQENGFISR